MSSAEPVAHRDVFAAEFSVPQPEPRSRARGDLSSRGDLSWQMAAFAVSCEFRNFGVVSLFVSVGFLLAIKSQLARASEPDASANQTKTVSFKWLL